MKEQLIKGKWYKAFSDQNSYIKFNTECREEAYCSEYISPENIYSKCDDSGCGLTKFLTPINISEIAHLLPKNHLDLNQIIEIW